MLLYYTVQRLFVTQMFSNEWDFSGVAESASLPVFFSSFSFLVTNYPEVHLDQSCPASNYKCYSPLLKSGVGINYVSTNLRWAEGIYTFLLQRKLLTFHFLFSPLPQAGNMLQAWKLRTIFWVIIYPCGWIIAIPLYGFLLVWKKEI